MTNIIDYTIASGHTVHDLSTEVKKLIALGWKPAFSITYAKIDGLDRFFQLMVRYGDK
jgi:hypothetical protein